MTEPDRSSDGSKSEHHDRLTPGQRRRAQATEDAWRQIEAEFGLLTAEEVAERTGWSVPDVHTAHQVGRLLAVHRGGQPRFPGYQIAPGGPRPVFQQLHHRAHRLGVREASVLLWMTVPTTWWSLEGSRPVDHLDDPAGTLVESDGVAELLRAFESHFGMEW